MVLCSAYSLYWLTYHITVVSGNTLEAVKMRREYELPGVKKLLTNDSLVESQKNVRRPHHIKYGANFFFCVDHETE